jgi:signal transduction histidine kinase
MPLVQALVDLHNGRLKIESVIGEGTRVTVEFPVTAEVAGKLLAMS